MSQTLFNTFSVRRNLKFYKTENNEEKITLSIGVNANHQVSKNIYEKVNEFLEKLLIEDYISEDTYNNKKSNEKQQKDQEKKINNIRKTKRKKLKK